MEMCECDEVFTTFETFFNVAGGIPFVALVSTAVRLTAGKVQFVTGIVMGVAGLIGQCFSSKARKWENITHIGGENILHGALNVIRGIAEGLIGLTIVGSLVLLVAQLILPNGFAPIFKYDMAPQPARAY